MSMRSARAVSVKPRSPRARARPRPRSASLRRRLAAPARSPRTSAAKRAKRGRQNASTRGEPPSAANSLSAIAISSAAISSGSAVGMVAARIRARRDARSGRARRRRARRRAASAPRAPRCAGEDRVGIGDPLLDAGHAQLARPCLDGRAGLGGIDRREGWRRSRSRAQATQRLLGREPRRGLRRLDQGVAAVAASARARSARRRP